MDIKKLLEEQIESIQKRLKEDDLHTHDFLSLHHQLERYINLYLRYFVPDNL